MKKYIRRMFAMQTVEERAQREQAENARAIYEAERRLQHTRHEIAFLRKRNAHLSNLTGVSA